MKNPPKSRKTAVCDNCGESINVDNLTIIEHKIYCESCKNKLFAECTICKELSLKEEVFLFEECTYCPNCKEHFFSDCSECGETTLHSRLVTTDNGDVFCPTCKEEILSSCDECGVYLLTDDSRILDGAPYCPECYDNCISTCYACNCEIHTRAAVEAHRTSYCQSCFDERFFICEECGEQTYLEDRCGDDDLCSTCYEDSLGSCSECGERINSSEPTDHQLCSECYNASQHIHRYSYKPDYINYGEELPLIGFELEVDDLRGMDNTVKLAQHINEIYPFLYCKHDGSLDHGIEVVSHPMDWKFIKANEENFSQLLTTISAYGFRSHDTNTCGMHVHITKKSVSPFQAYKIMKLIYENPDFTLEISQRKKSDIRQWANIYYTHETLPSMAKKRNNYIRNVAYNMQNSNTDEFRLFKGTLVFGSFMKNLEFVKAVYEFTANGSRLNITVPNFVKYISDNKKEYHYLLAFLRAKNLT